MSTPPASKPSTLPPGLAPPDAAVAQLETGVENLKTEASMAMRAVAAEAMEKQLSKVGTDHADREKIVAAVRQIVSDDVDARVKEKADQLWQRGKAMLDNLQSKHKGKTEALVNEVTMCQQKQQQLEAENEKLKEVLAGLAHRFSMLGAVFAQKGANGLVADAAAGGYTPAELSSPAIFTPMAEAAKVSETGEPSKFPSVPEFPFGSPAAAPAPSISLAEALPPQSPQGLPQPLSLASTLTPPASPGEFNGDSFTFSFTLRKADGADLGLNVSHHESDLVLRVEGVRQDGAMEAWNRQCAGSAFAHKAVLPNDTIVSVNGISYDPAKMLLECRDKQLLKLTIVRQRTPAPAFANKPPTQLRAEAPIFVPPSPAIQDPPEQKPATDAEDPKGGEAAVATAAESQD